MIRVKPEGIVEWVGAVLVLLAFLLLTLGYWQAQSVAYLTANVVGSLCIAYGALAKRDLPPVMLNIVWLLVALIGLARLL